MKISRFTALGGIAAVVALALSAPALGAGSGVSVRVEGLKRTLLPATVAHAERRAITKGGTPAAACPGSSAAGYFDNATHHRWSGSYSSGLGIAVTTVLGETHTLSAKYYWGIWINDWYAPAGLCGLKLKPGDRLLLAPAPASGATTYPIVLSAPAHAKVGKPFTVRSAYLKTRRGAAKPLARVKITDAGAVTDRHGNATITARRAGKLTVVASLKGYVRAEAVVTVSK